MDSTDGAGGGAGGGIGGGATFSKSVLVGKEVVVETGALANGRVL